MSTPDLSSGFYDAWTAMARRLDADPLDIARVAHAESGLRSTAVDRRSNAGGLIGFMPHILTGLGWTGTPEEFRQLSPTEQVPYVERYYRPYSGMLKNDGLVYVANFLPSRLPRAAQSDDSFVLTRAGEVYYDSNRILDRDGDGTITVGDLRRHLTIQNQGPRYATIESELRARGAGGSMVARQARSLLVPAVLGLTALGAWYLYYDRKGIALRTRTEQKLGRLISAYV